MAEQKSNCEENDSETAADDSAPPEQPVLSEGEPNPTPAEETPKMAGETPAPPMEDGRSCALCNCEDRSLYGQRELRLFAPSADRPPLPHAATASSSDPPAGCAGPGADDLDTIGFPELTAPASLFNDTGHCWVHHWCAAWSEGVRRANGQELENVDGAVISGIQQRCEYCRRLGATIRCQSEGCRRFYHFPCAAASGSFQSMKQLALLCPEHIEKAVDIAGEDSRCAVCDSAGELSGLLFCTGCGTHYHAACLEISATPLQRAGWQCPECKVCQTCRQPGEDSMMLVCDACDKGYHTFCLQPAMDSVPSDPWKCRRCRVCSECGTRGSSSLGSAQWFDNYSVCENCHRLRSSVCSACKKTEPAASLRSCQSCNGWVHIECASLSDPQGDKYTCTLCQASPSGGTVETDTPMELGTEADAEEPMAEEGSHLDTSALPQEQPSTVSESTEGGESKESEPHPVVAVGEDDAKNEETQNPPSRDGSPAATAAVATGSSKEQQEAEPSPALESVPEEEGKASDEGACPSHTPVQDKAATPSPEAPPPDIQGEEPVAVAMEEMGTETQEPKEAMPQTSPASPKEAPPAVEMDMGAVPSEEEEEEEEEEPAGDKELPMEELPVEEGKVKQEPEQREAEGEAGAKPELFLDEMSNLSHGDGSSSGFLGSPGEPDSQSISLDLSLVPAGRARSDSLLTETDDSLPFDTLKAEGDKAKRRGSPGRSRVKQGRSSSFPGKRRPRGGGSGRGRGRSRLKAMASCIEAFLNSFVIGPLPVQQSMDTDTGLGKEEDEDEDDTMQNTVVLFSNTDKFVLLQDMCVVCGSFGLGVEGQLLACAQCAQCYHPYCVNSKITKVMLVKGWRCLECIVCEVCGKASDPARLLLCDDCDVSYHTYCLDPPLHTVPKGGWKCKWCVCCMQCGASSPGFHCEWQNNYTHCAPCASLVTCPVCRENFMEEELLLQCQHCDRWMHAVCESLYTEDEVEQASDEGFTCTACSPYVPKPVVVMETPVVTPVKVKEPEPQFYRLEGVWLTETGMSLLRSISMSPLHKRRQRRSRMGVLCGEAGPDGLELKEGDGEGDEVKGAGESMDCEPKLEAPGSPDREGGPERETGPEGCADGCAEGEGMKGGVEETEEGKKRKRKPYRPGIGGFMVRQRKSHTRMKKGLVLPLAGETTADGPITEKTADEGPPDTPVDGPPDLKAAEPEGEQAKKRRGRKKSKLEDMFPAYLQEAFFGKMLLDLSRKAILPTAGQREGSGAQRASQAPLKQLPPSQDPTALSAAPSALGPGERETVPEPGEETEGAKEDSEQLKTEEGLGSEARGDGAASTGATGAQQPSTPKDSTSTTPGGAAGSGADKMSEGLPQGVESQDSEQFFRKVLGVSDGAALGGTLQAPMRPMLDAGQGELNPGALQQRAFLPAGSISGSLPSAAMMDSFPALSQSPFFDSRDRAGLFSPDQMDTDSPWATPSTPSTPPTPTEQESDGLSYNQRSLQRWEKDEELGEMSTISPVLYANLNFPSLKQEYPDWSSRCKQIMKIWRKVSAADKVPYLQKAKDNRAAQRINKAQKQAESQVCRPVKMEGRKGERPNLHLQIPPPPSASLSTPSQPSSAESPFPFPPDPGSAFFPAEGPLKTPSSGDSRGDPFAKLPHQSPHSHPHPYSNPSTPYSQPASSPLQVAPSSGFPPAGPQGAPQVRPPSLGSLDPQMGTPGTPRRPQPTDPFLRPQQQLQQTPQEPLAPPESPRSRPGGPGDSPLMSPPPAHFGDPFRNQQAPLRQEFGGTPSRSPSASSSSPAGLGLQRTDLMGVPSPHSSSAGRQDFGTGSPAAMGFPESGEGKGGTGLFKAPLTPRAHQGEAANPPQGCFPTGAPVHPSASPNHPSESYRRSPSTPFSDPYAQPPLTPRPQSGDGCSPVPQRPPLPLQEPYARVPASPQSHSSSSQSPLTPGALSNDAFSVHSPATPRFQSPDPYSRPPSRPQSRDPFAPLHKPPRPPSATAEGNAGYRGSPHLSQPPPPQAVGDPLSGKPPGPPAFSRSPNMGVFPASQSQQRMPFGDAVPPQPHPQALNASGFPSRLQPGPGTPETFTPRPPEAPMCRPPERRDDAPAVSNPQELPDLSLGQDPSLVGLSQSELEKHRQRQRLRELLIRQQMQRHSLRQEKEAAAASNGATSWTGDATVYQPDKTQRAPPPYPSIQERTAVTGGVSAMTGKLAPPLGSLDDKMSRPPPPGTPAMLDPSALRQPVPSTSQGFYPRSPFLVQWQGQAGGLRRFPQPSSLETGAPRHPVNIPVSGIQGLPNPRALAPGPGGEPMQGSHIPVAQQFIELRHNAQRLPLGTQFVPRGTPPQPRPRLYGPPQELGTPFAQPTLPPPPPPSLVPPAEGVRESRLGLQPGALSLMLPQQSTVPSPQPQQQAQIPNQPSGPSPHPHTHTQPELPPTEAGGVPQVTPSNPAVPRPCRLDLPEPDLDDAFVSKGLGGTGGEGGEDDVDDLATLDLDPDKGDDDLGNLDSLETTDPHLDDLLKCDEFDLLAYTDPELDQGDPKDAFSDQLRLVEAESEVPGPSLSATTPDVKVEPKPGPILPGQDPLMGSAASAPSLPTPSAAPLPSASLDPSSLQESSPSDQPQLPVLKLEDGGLPAGLGSNTGSQTPTCSYEGKPQQQQQPAVPPVVKDEVGEAVSRLLGGSTPAAKPSNGISPHTVATAASLSSVRLGGVSYSLPGQVDPLSFTSATPLPHADLDEDPLGLPDGGGQHSPAVDLDKVESSLEASELPLLIQDLLEHEKKELQKQQQQQQQLNSLHQGAMNTHMHSIPQQQQQPQPPQAQPQVLLQSQHHRTPPHGLMGQQFQPGMMPRPPHIMSPQQQQQQQQQRLLGAAMPPPSHVAMAQSQGMMGAGQPGGHPHAVNPQQQQQPQMVKQPQLANSFLPDTDLDKFAADDIMDPIAKAKMVALKGIKRVMAQGNIAMAPGINRQQVSLLAQRLAGAPGASDLQSRLPAGPVKEGEGSEPTQARPNPPQFVQGIINDAEQHQYEEWLLHTQQLLQMQLKFLEEQIGVHRKSRKALCAKQRTAKKAGREFPEADAEKLKLVTEQQSKIQKQLDQVRKQQKEHTNLMTEYRNKQQQHQQGSGILAPGPSTQGPRLVAKLPGQLMAGQQGAPLLGQQPVRMPPLGMNVAGQQGQPFPGGAQTPHPGALGAATPVPSGGYFPQGAGAPGPDARLLQERQMQLQHRMQLVQKMQQQQQQGMMGQLPMPQQAQQPGILGQQPGGVVGQPQQGIMGNPMMAQQQPPQQQGMMGPQQLVSNQQGMMGTQQIPLQSQQGQVQAPQGMIGNQPLAQAQQSIMAGQQIGQTPGIMGNQQGMMGSQQVLLQQQRAQGLMAQQGIQRPLGPQQQALRGPQGLSQLTPQQQNVLAQRMLLSQQQHNAAKNLAHLQQQQQMHQLQQQHLQQQQQSFLNQSSQQQDSGGQLQPTPSQPGSAEPQGLLGPSPPAGASHEGLQPQGAPDGLQPGGQSLPLEPQGQNSSPKEVGLLSPRPQQQGPSTPVHIQQPGSAGDHHGAVLQQQTHIYMGQQQSLQQQQPPNPSTTPAPQQQHSYLGGQQTGMLSQAQQQQQLALQRQNSLGGEKPGLITIKQEGQQMCYMAQQQGTILGQKPGPQPQGMVGQQNMGVMGQQQGMLGQQQAVLGQNNSSQPQPGMMAHPTQQQQQQQALLVQQKQAMMGQMAMGQQVVRGQQGMMGQRTGGSVATMGQVQASLSLQNYIAQNPQLRHLPPQQQIQAILAQRQLQQGQMLRQAANQGQVQLQGQQGQGQQVPSNDQRMQGLMSQQQQFHQGALVQQGASGSPQQQGVIGSPQQQQPGIMGQSAVPQQMTPQAQPQHGLPTQQQQAMQHTMMTQQQLQQQLQQKAARSQTPVQQGMMGQVNVPSQGCLIRPMSPRQALGHSSPGDPLCVQQQRHVVAQAMASQPTGLHQASPTQALHYQQLIQKQQQHPPHTAASSPFQAPQIPGCSPARAVCPAPSDTAPISTSVQQQEAISSPARVAKREPGTLTPSNPGSASAETERNLGQSDPAGTKAAQTADANRPVDQPGLKSECQPAGNAVGEDADTKERHPNGPSPQKEELQQPAGQGSESQTPQAPTGSGSSDSLYSITLQNIKQEPGEVQCDGVGPGAEGRTGAIKRESNGEPVGLHPTTAAGSGSTVIPSSPDNPAAPPGPPGSTGPRSETGQQLLQKLLRTKNLQLAAQRPSDGIHSEINGHINSKLALLEQKLQATPRNMEDLQSITKKPAGAKPKRTPKSGDRVANSRKKTKKEEMGKSTEALMKHLKQELSLLPLMEPSIAANLDLFSPFGSSPANGKAQLKGSFGNAVLDNIPDYYSQLLTKNNLSNPPTPPSSLPPTPPPSVQHKLLNGVTAVEELTEGQKEPDAPSEAEEPKDSAAEEVKSMDLLAALPTPPHNQNEDIRMESDEDSDAPDSIVPASSPESVLGDEAPRFPLLGDARLEESERAFSPVIPIIPRTSIPVFPDKPFEFPEHGKVAPRSSLWDKAKGSEVSVTFTLSAAAAKNLNTVMVAVAQLLHMRMPVSYEVAFPQSPGRGAAEPGKPAPDSSAPGALCPKPSPSEEERPTQEKADWLKQFDVSLPGCTLKKQVDILSLIKQECPEPEQKPVQHCYTANVSNLDVRHLPIIPVEASPPQSPSPPPPPPPAPAVPPDVQPTSPSPASLADAVKPEPEPEPILAPPPPPLASVPAAPTPALPANTPALIPAPEAPKLVKQRGRPASEDEEVRPKVKKWKGLRWKRLQLLITIRKAGSRRESAREISELMERLRITLRPDVLPRDLRKCCFCHEEGDGATDGPARLLNIDLDLWVHLNCALWSTEVYETQGGALINVEVALRRGLRTRCAYCQKTGATNSCNRLRCPNVYHFACAIRARCMFFKDKTMLCTQHKLKGPSEEELSSFAVFRRVYIERDEVKQIASILQRGDRIHMFRVGGLIFHAVGQLLPSQMAAFHSSSAIFPVGYEATRIYWSTRLPNRRCCYRCRISEEDGRPLFEVRVLEQGHEDLLLRESSPQALWDRVVEQVARLRQEAEMLKLFTDHVKGEEMYGLTVHAVLRITESLPGVENCQNYVFRYGRHPLMELPLMINPTGCARSEPKILTHFKRIASSFCRPHTLNSTSMSKAYQSTFTGEINTPYSKQFVHSKSSQYRRLKTEWKNNVYLARSRIQGLGLYAAKDLEKHTMVIEYIGTIIRNEVANRREKIYEEQNRGIYMFRINNEHVIDATLTGGPARYVNHSCAPNCVAEVVTFDKEDKIIIISSRRIPKGEELTYDYQFDFEDDQHKIPCHCGAWNCRKWMN
nr:PREDICTED: histone-lysine N-methyltransferase 2D isoform X3 [Lepisosteus oculatus]